MRQTACDYCKRRKKKCDGTRPSCDTCLHSNIECVYSFTFKPSIDAPLDADKSTKSLFSLELEPHVLTPLKKDIFASLSDPNMIQHLIQTYFKHYHSTAMKPTLHPGYIMSNLQNLNPLLVHIMFALAAPYVDTLSLDSTGPAWQRASPFLRAIRYKYSSYANEETLTLENANLHMLLSSVFGLNGSMKRTVIYWSIGSRILDQMRLTEILETDACKLSEFEKEQARRIIWSSWTMEVLGQAVAGMSDDKTLKPAPKIRLPCTERRWISMDFSKSNHTAEIGGASSSTLLGSSSGTILHDEPTDCFVKFHELLVFTPRVFAYKSLKWTQVDQFHDYLIQMEIILNELLHWFDRLPHDQRILNPGLDYISLYDYSIQEVENAPLENKRPWLLVCNHIMFHHFVISLLKPYVFYRLDRLAENESVLVLVTNDVKVHQAFRAATSIPEIIANIILPLNPKGYFMPQLVSVMMFQTSVFLLNLAQKADFFCKTSRAADPSAFLDNSLINDCMAACNVVCTMLANIALQFPLIKRFHDSLNEMISVFINTRRGHLRLEQVYDSGNDQYVVSRIFSNIIREENAD